MKKKTMMQKQTQFLKKIKTTSVLHNVRMLNRTMRTMKRKKMRVVEQKKAVNSQNNKTRKENNQVMEDR
jgi:hypothetical protein|tara:strand:+ start:217 stop:423 length:207 start_codon:yes stop_codon:yes gene_type:complete